jgi:hypothetical protein
MQSTSFKRLIGTWKTEGIIFDGQANTRLSGIDTYEWILNGQYILHKARVMMGEEESETFEIISAGKAETEAKMQYYNSRGEEGVETATLAENEYRIEAEGMRFEGVINDDNSRISGKWALRTAQGDWKDYIELTLVKQNSTA